jgi:hypothetical protein
MSHPNRLAINGSLCMGGGHTYLPFRELYHSGLNPPHQYTFYSQNNIVIYISFLVICLL